MKVCSKCRLEKELNDFSKRSASKDGLNPRCKSCDKAYKEANKERINDYQKAYRKANKERLKTRDKAWRQANKERIKTRDKDYRKANKERLKACFKAWRQANSGKINSLAAKRRAAKLQRTPHWLTEEDHLDIQAFYIEAKRLTKETGINHHVDHIRPLQGRTVSGLHCPLNLQILTATENLQKNNSYEGETA